MSTSRFQQNPNAAGGGNTVNRVLSLVFIVAMIYMLIKIFGFVTKLLWYVAPIILIATLIMDYKVVLSYGKSLVNLTKKNTAFGAIAIILSLLGLPFVSLFLFSKAMTNRKIGKMQEQFQQDRTRESSFTEYEDVSEKTEVPEVKVLDLEEKVPQKETNNYEDLFTDIEIEDEGNGSSENLWD